MLRPTAARLSLPLTAPTPATPMHCQLVIPDLFWPDFTLPAAYADLRLPSLEMLLARGRRSVVPAAGRSGWLATCFALPAASAIAPYRASGDGLHPGAECWLCADPVHLEAGMERISLQDGSSFELSEAEAQSLLATLNAHFAVDGLELIAPHPLRWYVRGAAIDADCELDTVSPEAARGWIGNESLPGGTAGPRWRARMTEAQMLMHEHPVNETRELAGKPTVNGVWFWGAGRLAALEDRRSERWYSDDPLVRGLALAAGAQIAAAPDAIEQTMVPNTGKRWYLLEQAADAVHRADLEGWQRALRELETRWFAPLVAMLRKGTIGMLSLHAVSPTETLSVEATRVDLRHLWRRRRPLADYLASPAT